VKKMKIVVVISLLLLLFLSPTLAEERLYSFDEAVSALCKGPPAPTLKEAGITPGFGKTMATRGVYKSYARVEGGDVRDIPSIRAVEFDPSVAPVAQKIFMEVFRDFPFHPSGELLKVTHACGLPTPINVFVARRALEAVYGADQMNHRVPFVRVEIDRMTITSTYVFPVQGALGHQLLVDNFSLRTAVRDLKEVIINKRLGLCYEILGSPAQAAQYFWRGLDWDLGRWRITPCP
jgi:hypothetical protein